MWNKIKNWLLPKGEEFQYNVLVQAEPERKVVVVKKAAAKKPAAKRRLLQRSLLQRRLSRSQHQRRSKWENITIK